MKYIAFLRAINVGGHNKIKMDELSKIFMSMGFKNVKTFIQSGNIIFESKSKNLKVITQKIDKKLQSEIGRNVISFLRKENELDEILKKNPFRNKKLDEDTRIYIALFNAQLDSETKKIVKSLNNKNETYFSEGKEVYCLIRRDEKRGSFFSILQLEKKLSLPLTTRNFNTLSRIKDMLDNE